jgi:hypothetical protein
MIYRWGFLGRWWCVVAEAKEFHMLVVVGIELVGFGNVAEVGVEVVLVVWLLEQRLLTLLLLAENFDVVLELRESCPFSVGMLPSNFGALSCYLPLCDGFLFSMDPLDLLLDPGQLLFFCNFIFVGHVFLIIHLDLFEICIFLDDLYQ